MYRESSEQFIVHPYKANCALLHTDKDRYTFKVSFQINNEYIICLSVISYECILKLFKTFHGHSFSRFLINYRLTL